MSLTGTDYYYSEQQQGIDRRTKEFVVERCLPFISGPRVLDFGYVDDMWVSSYLRKGWVVDVVEGNFQHIEQAQKLFSENSRVNLIHSLFEEFSPTTLYDSLVLGDVIRYIEEPVEFLKKVKAWLNPGGNLIITVPNMNSMHRRIGALMGMEENPRAANQQDKIVGNLRGYDRYSLRYEIVKSGWEIIELRGCFLKPLSSEQIKSWDAKLLRAFLDIGNELEDYAWFIYAVCKIPSAHD